MRILSILSLSALALSACSYVSPGVRETTANHLARPVFMMPRMISANEFTLKTYERIDPKVSVASVYIEGAEDTGTLFNDIQENASPKWPVGLELASYDSAPNVIYLARPCQYPDRMKKSPTCNFDYLGSKMFAPEILAAYNTALDDLKKRYGLQGFHMIGYGSGGGLAALLSAQRGDVKSLRTVAGLLDTQTYARDKNLTGFENSFNPINNVPQLVRMPQHHYIAQNDKVIPNTVYHSYAQAFGDDNCLNYTFVQGVGHDYDWSKNWVAYLKEPVACKQPPAPVSATPAPVVFSPEQNVERMVREQEVAPEIGPK